ncbi:MAG: ATP synthase F1 subunit epsilon [Alphaproteobacteria bacterium]|nr:ATP synthase F1 subunit epsilon [Alphaproteobacteria bacterium]
MNTLQFDLVSPEKKLFSAPVAMATLPGTEGDFSVLAGHAPFISTMRVGVIDVYEEKETQITKRMLVSGGIVEVNPTGCTVLAEEVVPLEDVSVESLGVEHTKLVERLAVAEGDAKVALRAAVELSEKKLELLRFLRYHH